MKFSAAVVRILTLGVLTTIAGYAAAQQAHPNKSIRLMKADMVKFARIVKAANIQQID